MNNKSRCILGILLLFAYPVWAQDLSTGQNLDSWDYTYTPLFKNYRQVIATSDPRQNRVKQSNTPVQNAAQRLRQMTEDNDKQDSLSNNFYEENRNSSLYRQTIKK